MSATVPALLEEIQAALLAEATADREARTHDAATVDEAAEASADGFARIPWAVLRDNDGEARLLTGKKNLIEAARDVHRSQADRVPHGLNREPPNHVEKLIARLWSRPRNLGGFRRRLL